MIKRIFIILVSVISGINFLLADSEPASKMMLRDVILEVSSNYVKGLYNPDSYDEKWLPRIVQATNKEVANSVIFKSFFTKNGYLEQEGGNEGEPSGEFIWPTDKNKKQYTLGQKVGDNSQYWVVPYSLSGFDSPATIKDRVEAGDDYTAPVPGTELDSYYSPIKGPICPGGYTARAQYGANVSSLDGNANYIYDSSHNKQWAGSDMRKYITGIDCIGFVSRALGLEYQLGMGQQPTANSQTIYNVSLRLNDIDELKPGDFVIAKDHTHTRLFIGSRIVNGQKMYFMREAAPPFVRDISYTKAGLKNSYEPFTIYPQFISSKPTGVYRENAPDNIDITVNCGYSIGNLRMVNTRTGEEITGFNIESYDDNIIGHINDANQTYKRQRAVMKNLKLTYYSTGVANLEKAEYQLTAANVFGQANMVIVIIFPFFRSCSEVRARKIYPRTFGVVPHVLGAKCILHFLA